MKRVLERRAFWSCTPLGRIQRSSTTLKSWFIHVTNNLCRLLICSRLPLETLSQIEAVRIWGLYNRRILREADMFVFVPLELLIYQFHDLEKVDLSIQYFK
jgi:hypothetical protein